MLSVTRDSVCGPCAHAGAAALGLQGGSGDAFRGRIPGHRGR